MVLYPRFLAWSGFSSDDFSWFFGCWWNFPNGEKGIWLALFGCGTSFMFPDRVVLKTGRFLNLGLDPSSLGWSMAPNKGLLLDWNFVSWSILVGTSKVAQLVPSDVLLMLLDRSWRIWRFLAEFGLAIMSMKLIGLSISDLIWLILANFAPKIRKFLADFSQ